MKKILFLLVMMVSFAGLSQVTNLGGKTTAQRDGYTLTNGKAKIIYNEENARLEYVLGNGTWVPFGGSGSADGVVTSATLVGDDLTLTRSVGAPVTFDTTKFPISVDVQTALDAKLDPADIDTIAELNAIVSDYDLIASGTDDQTGAEVPLTGYTKPLSASTIAPTDTANEAIGKLERALDDVGGCVTLQANGSDTNVDDSDILNWLSTPGSEHCAPCGTYYYSQEFEVPVGGANNVQTLSDCIQFQMADTFPINTASHVFDFSNIPNVFVGMNFKKSAALNATLNNFNNESHLIYADGVNSIIIKGTSDGAPKSFYRVDNAYFVDANEAYSTENLNYHGWVSNSEMVRIKKNRATGLGLTSQNTGNNLGDVPLVLLQNNETEIVDDLVLDNGKNTLVKSEGSENVSYYEVHVSNGGKDNIKIQPLGTDTVKYASIVNSSSTNVKKTAGTNDGAAHFLIKDSEETVIKGLRVQGGTATATALGETGVYVNNIALPSPGSLVADDIKINDVNDHGFYGFNITGTISDLHVNNYAQDPLTTVAGVWILDGVDLDINHTTVNNDVTPTANSFGYLVRSQGLRFNYNKSNNSQEVGALLQVNGDSQTWEVSNNTMTNYTTAGISTTGIVASTIGAFTMNENNVDGNATPLSINTTNLTIKTLNAVGNQIVSSNAGSWLNITGTGTIEKSGYGSLALNGTASVAPAITAGVTMTTPIVDYDAGGGSGGIQSVVAGSNVTIDNTDPNNPIVNAGAGSSAFTDNGSYLTANENQVRITDSGSPESELRLFGRNIRSYYNDAIGNLDIQATNTFLNSNLVLSEGKTIRTAGSGNTTFTDNVTLPTATYNSGTANGNNQAATLDNVFDAVSAGGGGGTDDQTIDEFSYNTTNNTISLSLEGDGQVAQTVVLDNPIASEIDYDNTYSELDAVDVRQGLDELTTSFSRMNIIRPTADYSLSLLNIRDGSHKSWTFPGGISDHIDATLGDIGTKGDVVTLGNLTSFEHRLIPDANTEIYWPDGTNSNTSATRSANIGRSATCIRISEDASSTTSWVCLGELEPVAMVNPNLYVELTSINPETEVDAVIVAASGNADVNSVATPTSNGGFSWEIDKTGATGSQGFGRIDLPLLTIGTTYVISIDCYSTGGAQASPAIFDGFPFGVTDSSLQDTWETITFTVTATGTNGKILLQARNIDPTGSKVYFDNLIVKEQ